MRDWTINVRAVVKATCSDPEADGSIPGWEIYDAETGDEGAVTLRCDRLVRVRADDQAQAIERAIADAPGIALGDGFDVESVDLWVDPGIDVDPEHSGSAPEDDRHVPDEVPATAGMTPEEKEHAKRRIYPLLKTLVSVKDYELGISQRLIAVGKGEFDPQTMLGELLDLRKKLLQAIAADEPRIERMLGAEQLKRQGKTGDPEEAARRMRHRLVQDRIRAQAEERARVDERYGR